MRRIAIFIADKCSLWISKVQRTAIFILNNYKTESIDYLRIIGNDCIRNNEFQLVLVIANAPANKKMMLTLYMLPKCVNHVTFFNNFVAQKGIQVINIGL